MIDQAEVLGKQFRVDKSQLGKRCHLICILKGTTAYHVPTKTQMNSDTAFQMAVAIILSYLNLDSILILSFVFNDNSEPLVCRCVYKFQL